MKLKIKIKNLILITLAAILMVLIVVPFTTLQIANILSDFNSDKATVFYESYLRKMIKPNEVQALYKYADHLGGTKDKFIIGISGWSFPQSKITLGDMEKAKESLIKILNNEKSSIKYRKLAYRKLLDVLVSSGQNRELINWIQYGSTSEDEEINYTSSIYNALLKGDYELADKILNNFNGLLDRDYYIMKGYIALLNGKDETAKEYYDKARISYWYEDYKELFKGQYKVRGKVSYNGVGIPFAEIDIQEANGGFRTGAFGFSAITDINGEYETIGLRSGRYDIRIGINHVLLYDKVHLKQNISFLELEEDLEFNFDFVDPIRIIEPDSGTIVDSDKFEVKWEPVEGAAYYKIETISYSNPMDKNSGMVTYSIKQNFKSENLEDTKVILDVERLRSEQRIYGYEDNGVPTPATILGGFFPGFDYPIIVKAYDVSGNLIGSSQGQRVYLDQMNSINIKGKLSKGEYLISKGQYEKAIEHYKNVLDNNPEDMEALKYLAKFYTLGWKEGTIDYIKAIDYGKRYYALSKDSYLLMLTVSEMNYEDKISYKAIAKEILDSIAEEEKDFYYYNQLGTYYESIGDFSQAIRAYEKMDAYIPFNILLMDLYLGDFNSALERLNNPNLQLYMISRKTLIKSIETLGPEDLESQDYKYFQEILEKELSGELRGEEGKQLFYKLRKMIQNHDIRAILDEFKERLL